MKKILLMFVALLLGSELQAQRYDGVNPCSGPGLVRTIIDSTLGIYVSTESSAGGGGGLLCNIMIATGAVSVTGGGEGDYVACISSSPRSFSTGLPSLTANLGTQIDVSTDTNLIAPAVLSVASVTTGLPSSWVPIPFRNLFCDISNTRTRGFVYWVPSVR